MIDAGQLLEVLDDAFLVCSASGEIRHANAAARATLATSSGEALVGASLRALAGEAAMRELARAMKQGGERRLDVAGRDGRPLSLRIVPRGDDEAWAFLRADPRPHDAAGGAYLRAVLHHAPVVLFSFDADGTFTMSAGLGLERLGVAEGELVGRSMFERFRDEPWVVESARRSLAGETVTAAGRVDGVDYEVSYQPVCGPDGRVVSVLGVATDVTERQRALERLESERMVMEYVIEHVPHAIFWKDREGRFTGANQNFLNDTGLPTPAELIGKTDHDVWPPSEASFFVEIDRRVMSTGVPILDIEEPLSRADGERRCLLTSKVPMRNAQGEVTGVLGIYADITRRKQMELELAKAKEAADAAARAKSELLTVMSHELRTPLALIIGPIESLLAGRAGELDARARDALGRIQRNAGRLHRLVDEVLTYQQLEHRTLELSPEPVDVRELVERLVLDAQPAAESTGIELALELASDVGAAAIDRRMLEKILFNLLGNALKLTPPGGRVVVSLARLPGDRLELAVADTGPGIAKEDHEIVFQRFRQLDGSTRRRHEGMGLGLALVKELAERMGGRVTLASALGRGARFAVELPLGSVEGLERTPRTEARPPPAPPAAPRPREPREGELARVLVAEDNADMRAYLDEILSESFDVELTANGAEALSAARARRPEVIVSDVMMPEMHGYELVARLKASADLRDVPVILLSARAAHDDVVEGLEAGADDYVLKPFMPEELIARVRAALRLRRAFVELAAQKLELEDALRRLADSQEELVQTSKMAAMGTLLAGLSHELNNPLGIIRMSAQHLLRHASGDARTSRTLEAIERQATRSAALVGGLIELSRRGPVSTERCAIEHELEWLLELARPEANERGITLRASIGAGLPSVLVHRAALESALLNLIGNALDASPEGGVVEVQASARVREDGRPGAEIVVTDQGPGIAREDLPHVFDPFFTKKEPGEGTGLGLAMTYRFVETHGGTIRIESEPGHGVTARMWLPLVPPPSATSMPLITAEHQS